MTIITGKHLSRRTLLRGVGAAVALPLLDAMHPSLARAAARPGRVGVVYVPNGIVMNDWKLKEVGTDFAFTRILKPLEPFRGNIVVLSGLSNNAASKAQGGGHAKASGSFLSSAQPKYTAGADVRAGITFDQIAARQWAAETRVPSIQLGCEDSRMVGNCDTGSSCAYTNTLSWRDADKPMAVEVNPRSVFERLFGTVDPSLDPATRARRALYRKSILDQTRESTQSLVKDLGPADRRKIDEYLTSVREVEKRISAAENDTLVPPVDKPSGIPFEYAEYVKLMFDLQAIAFQADVTRVSTMMLGREGSVRTYPEIGVPDPHHPLTHHRGHPDFIEKVTKINCFHVELFAYFLAKLKATPEGDGNLLDHSSILYGGALSDGNAHSNNDLPLVLAGNAGGRKGGRHVASDAKTPVANLFVSMLNSVGVVNGVVRRQYGPGRTSQLRGTLMNRRQFFQTAAAATAVSRLVAQDDVPNWGGNVIDVHLHPRQQAGGEWAHMQGCGVTHAVLLTNSRAVPHAKEEMASHPDRFKLFVSVSASAPDAMEQLRGFVKDGAIGFGEMKSPLKADSPEMLKVYALAGELGVPVTIHFGDVPQFAGDSSYNEGITRFGPVIKAHPKTIFFGHADSFWANVSNEVQDSAYPSGKIKPGGVTDKWLTEFPNLYGDMSANSCRNALGRDPEFMGKFLERHQDKLMFGSDCSCRDGRGAGQNSQAPLIKGKCVARETLTAVKGMASPAIFRKIAFGNASRMLKFKA